ncbi:MAG: hypothetical protein ACKPCM_04095, partial [Pseudanabaena sp.]
VAPVAAALTQAPLRLFQVSSPSSCYYKEDNSKILVAGNVVEGDALAVDGSLSNSADNGNNFTVAVHLFRGVGVDPTNGNASTDIGTNTGSTAGQIKLIDNTTQSLADNSSNRGRDVAFNDFAYNVRVNTLVNLADATFSATDDVVNTSPPITAQSVLTNDPRSVKLDIVSRIKDEGLTTQADFRSARLKALDAYFRLRLRKVPFREVPYGASDTVIFGSITPAITPVTTPSGSEWLPPLEWMIPAYSNTTTITSTATADILAGKALRQGTSGTVPTTLPTPVNKIGDLTLAQTAASIAALPATKPEDQRVTFERFLGDRVLVGNNLPALWLKTEGTINRYVANTEPYNLSTDNSIFWNGTETAAAIPNSARYRFTQASSLKSLGVSDRGGFWELNAADNPGVDANGGSTPTAVPVSGGLRVVTSAGVYSRRPTQTFLPAPPPLLDNPVTASNTTEPDPRYRLNESNFTVVWSDAMPMTGSVNWDGTAYRPWNWQAGRWANSTDPTTVTIDSIGTTAPN